MDHTIGGVCSIGGGPCKKSRPVFSSGGGVWSIGGGHGKKREARGPTSGCPSADHSGETEMRSVS
jgi:hypothetical protein